MMVMQPPLVVVKPAGLWPWSPVLFIPQQCRRNASTSITQITSQPEQLGGVCPKDLSPPPPSPPKVCCFLPPVDPSHKKKNPFLKSFNVHLHAHVWRRAHPVHSCTRLKSTPHTCAKPLIFSSPGRWITGRQRRSG